MDKIKQNGQRSKPKRPERASAGIGLPALMMADHQTHNFLPCGRLGNNPDKSTVRRESGDSREQTGIQFKRY